ncbi:cyclic nucleotide-binding domain-containing protein [bacterium]|nr:cyclic nucleotide-binding domain-containing protein [bacterium]MDB4423122.1 cyclic nucleotide-binding domain-containing protein [Rhodopirellula sp.]
MAAQVGQPVGMPAREDSCLSGHGNNQDWIQAAGFASEIHQPVTPATPSARPESLFHLDVRCTIYVRIVIMEAEDSITVRRPQRWSKPMDASMDDADVLWLRSREPFASMDAKSFPRSIPLESILRNDCQIKRCEPGEIIVREGDYGSSAFLVIAGSTKVVVDSLAPAELGRSSSKKLSWFQAARQFLRRSGVSEARRPDEVTTANDSLPSSSSIRLIDDRPAIFLQDFNAVLCDHANVELGPGELFGEVAAMYRSPRTATVIAANEATLLEIRWQGLRSLRQDKRFAANLDEHYRTHWLKIHLREVPLLRHLPEASLVRVAEATQMRSFGRLEWNSDYKRTRTLPVEQQIKSEPIVCEAGRIPTELVIVRSGFGRLSQQHGASHRTTAYIGKGHVFGLEELSYNSVRPTSTPLLSLQNTLRAVGFLDALFIPAETFASDILPHAHQTELPEKTANLLLQLAAQNLETETNRRQNTRKKPASASQNIDFASATGQYFQQTALLEFIVQSRLNNGRQAMVIDLHRCTRCDDCVKACSDAHDGNPRFVRQGLSHDRLQVVEACMQCSDPVCMIGCPTGSIMRDQESGVVQIHESICVGCGTCASACPYENIRMTEVFDHQGRLYRDATTDLPIEKATKCDMCSKLPSGPACVAACPHDALVRIDLTESKPLQEWLDLRS